MSARATWVFIYGICGVSLMVLVGYTGLVSLGHAAFLGIGAYAHAYFLQHGVPVGRRRWPWPSASPRRAASSSGCRRCA